jgi:tetratricopeptide (TPR) repeat protein
MEHSMKKKEVIHDALKVWKILNSMAQDSLEALHGTATTYLHLQDYHKALDYYKRAAKLYSYPGWNIDSANVYRAMGKIDLAIKYYRKSIALYPGDWIGWYNLAMAYNTKKRPKEAKETALKTLFLLKKKCFPLKEKLVGNLDQIIQTKKPPFRRFFC